MSWAEENGIDTYDPEDECLDNIARGIWITKEGKEIPVKEMTDRHLNNTIKYLERMRKDALGDGVYMGDSVYAEDVVESENAHNKRIRERIASNYRMLQREKERRQNEG